MKLAVMPMTLIREMACMPLTTVKVAPRAPNFDILASLGDFLGLGKFGCAGREGCQGIEVG